MILRLGCVALNKTEGIFVRKEISAAKDLLCDSFEAEFLGAVNNLC